MKKHQDWFDENNERVIEILKRKQTMLNKLLHDDLPEKEKKRLKKAYSDIKADVQRELRTMKNSWWQQKAVEIQSAADVHDSKSFYDKLKEVYGPSQSRITPMKSKDGHHTIRDAGGLMDRWTEHYRDLFTNPSTVDESIIKDLPQYDVMEAMDVIPDIDEIKKATAQIRGGKAPGLDGIPIEVVKCGGDSMNRKIADLIVDIWSGTPVYQDWKDAILVSIYKGKGKRSICGQYRGVSLLAAVGKIFSRILLNRLEKYLCPKVLPESQCGFRAGRGTTDMVFTVRQIQKKCIEHRLDLVQVFVDLTKAFDTVNRCALLIVLKKLGCPVHFVDMIQQLHDNMKARVSYNGKLSSSIPIDNGVKQGDIPAPTLFSIFFAVTLVLAIKDCDIGIYLRYRMTGKLFNIRRFNAKSKTFISIVRDLLYADDVDLVAHSEQDMQVIMDRFSEACRTMGLTISLNKTKVMFTPAPGNRYYEPNIIVNGTPLEVVDTFVYLGSMIAKDGSLDNEITRRIEQGSASFGKLEKRLWCRQEISIKTKLSIYEACVITTLLYCSETWTTYRRHIKVLERFHQNCLRHILKIRWDSYTPDTDVLTQAGSQSIETRIIKNRMRWSGHIIRQEDTRLPKQVLYGELVANTRPPHKPRKRYKDCLKNDMLQLKMLDPDWEKQAENRTGWRRLVHVKSKEFQHNCIKHAQLKRRARKMDNIEPSPNRGTKEELTCTICGRVTLSKAGFVSHMKSHTRRIRMVNTQEEIQHQDRYVCNNCGKICKNKSGHLSHLRAHERAGQD